MTPAKIIKLTAIVASCALTIGALAVYRGGFAQNITKQQQQQVNEGASVVDSAELARGLDELQHIIDHYSGASVLVNGEIRYYNGDSLATAADKAPFMFAVEGQNTQYELDSVITVTSGKTAVVVDKKDESIAVVEKDEQETQQPEAPEPMPTMLDAAKEFVREIKLGQNGQYSQLTLYFSEEAPVNVSEYVIVYDPKTYAIKKLRVKMQEAQLADALPTEEEDKLKVTEDDELFYVDSANNAIPTGMYAAVNTAVYEIVYLQEKRIEHGSIDIGSYIKKENGMYVPAGRYKNFSIQN